MSDLENTIDAIEGDDEGGESEAPAGTEAQGKKAPPSKALRRAIAQSKALSDQMKQMEYQVKAALEQQRLAHEQELRAAREEVASLRNFEQQRAEEERLQRLTGVDRFAHELRQDVKRDLDGGVSAAMQPVLDEIRNLKAERAQERQEQAREVKLSRARAEVAKVLENKLFKGLDPEALQEIRDLAEEQIFVASATMGTGPEESADRLMRFMTGYNKARYAAKQKAKATPPTRVQGSAMEVEAWKPGYSHTKRTPLMELAKAGFTVDGRPSRFAAKLAGFR